MLNKNLALLNNARNRCINQYVTDKKNKNIKLLTKTCKIKLYFIYFYNSKFFC